MNAGRPILRNKRHCSDQLPDLNVPFERRHKYLALSSRGMLIKPYIESMQANVDGSSTVRSRRGDSHL